jgi:hypothetical protein
MTGPWGLRSHERLMMTTRMQDLFMFHCRRLACHLSLGMGRKPNVRVPPDGGVSGHGFGAVPSIVSFPD